MYYNLHCVIIEWGWWSMVHVVLVLVGAVVQHYNKLYIDY